MTTGRSGSAGLLRGTPCAVHRAAGLTLAGRGGRRRACEGTTCWPRQAAPAVTRNTKMKRMCFVLNVVGSRQSGLACLGPTSGGAAAAGPLDTMAYVLAMHGLAAPGTIGWGEPAAGGRVLVQAIQDVPRRANNHVWPYLLRGAWAGRGPPAWRRLAPGLPVVVPLWSRAATAGGAGNGTPLGRPAGMAVGARVRLGMDPLGSGPPLAGRPRGRRLGKSGRGVRDVHGPGPASVSSPFSATWVRVAATWDAR